MQSRESKLETLVLDIIRLPHLSVDPGWVRRAEAVITGAEEPASWTCPACNAVHSLPNLGICDACKAAETSHHGGHDA